MENTNTLRSSIIALHGRLRELGSALESEARSVSTGAPPSDELPHRMETVRAEFFAARQTIISEARSAGFEGVGNRHLESIEQLLEVIDELLLLHERARQRSIRARARAILLAALEIEHASRQDSTVLDAVRAQARALLDAIPATPETTDPSDADALAADDHPLAHLVLLVQGEVMDDTRWEDLRRSIMRSFGLGIARAAVEGRLVLHPSRWPAERFRTTTEAALPPQAERTDFGPQDVALFSAAPPLALSTSAAHLPTPSVGVDIGLVAGEPIHASVDTDERSSAAPPQSVPDAAAPIEEPAPVLVVMTAGIEEANAVAGPPSEPDGVPADTAGEPAGPAFRAQ